MALDEKAITAKTMIKGTKSLTVSADKVIKVVVDGVDDADLTYTVPTGKTATIIVSMNGSVE